MNSETTEFVRQCSPFFDRMVRLHPDWFATLNHNGRLQGNLAPDAAVLQRRIDEHGLDVGLRRFRHQEMMRIVWRELSQTATLDQTMNDLSLLAEHCLQAAIEAHSARLQARFGVPRCDQGREQKLIVLGLGKLGGSELNLSSDIDLILCFPKAGACQGRGELSNEQFFTRLSRAMIKSLSEITDEGFCFRIDTRLRPFGESGPLVLSFGALEQYYQREGRDWERYALIKARTVAGDRHQGEELLERLKPFMYRRYIDYSVVEALQEMLDSIQADACRTERLDDLKRGPGGIREVEFLVQCHQLLRGGREPSLQCQGLLQALAELERLKLLSPQRATQLRQDYRFLRRLENTVQALHDQQTHSLPRGEDLLRVCQAMGFDDEQALRQELTTTTNRVREALEERFPRRSGTDTENPQGWMSLLRSGHVQWSPAMLGYEQRVERIPMSPKARSRLDQFMTMLVLRLTELSATVETNAHLALQDDALELVTAVCRRSAYLALLVQNPVALDRMLTLFLSSPWIAKTVTRYPALLDELIDPELGRNIPNREALASVLKRLMARDKELELQLETLNYVKSAQSLRLAVAELAQRPGGPETAIELTNLAELLLEAGLKMALIQVAKHHGAMLRPGLAVIAYGTFGGRDMNYGSDLDLVFLYGNERGSSDGDRPLDVEPYYTRLVRRLLALCTTLTSAGRLFSIDTRLRPNGQAGLLVSSIEAFAHYQHQKAWVWEWQALVRARPISGDPLLRAQFEAVRREVLTQPRDPQELMTEVRTMRQRMRQELTGQDPLKHGRGGLLDIDFVAQLGVLQNACNHPALVRPTETCKQLALLAECGWLDHDQARQLVETHQSLTRARHLQALGRSAADASVDRSSSWALCRKFLG